MDFSAPPDPFLLKSNLPTYTIWRATTGLVPRSQIINPTQKTLVLISSGQSQWTSINPTLYVPTNSAAIDQFNIYDGASYTIGAQLLGTTYNGTTGTFGPGSILPRLADIFVTNAIFNRVIGVPIAVSSTAVSQWGTGGELSDRGAVAMARLASRGITPSTPGVTFAFLWGQGESDQIAGTPQAAYAASLGQVLAAMTAAGFSGRMFVCRESYVNGVVSTAVQAAQTASVNGTTVFSGGDLDSLGSTSRQAEGTHFNDAGAASVATIVYNAMHASGAPY